MLPQSFTFPLAPCFISEASGPRVCEALVLSLDVHVFFIIYRRMASVSSADTISPEPAEMQLEALSDLWRICLRGLPGALDSN